MKIDTYAVETNASRVYEKSETREITIQKLGRDGSPIIQNEEAAMLELVGKKKDDIQRVAGETMKKIRNSAKEAGRVYTPNVPKTNYPQDADSAELHILELLLSRLLGRDINLNKFKFPARSSDNPTAMLEQTNVDATKDVPRDWGNITSVMEHSYEHEAVSYNALGVVNTADGKTIDFSVTLNMSRTVESFMFASSREVRQCDPLVINYGGTAASLTSTKYSFDLDADGTKDQISFAGQGSGFLALDKNDDGIINDGRELFGPQSGNGFEELRQYDADGNNWIDENDDVFSKLRIWSKDEEGNDVLYTLADLDVGALYLGDLETQFSVEDENGQQGQVRATSFYLKEKGGADVIQHIDLTV